MSGGARILIVDDEPAIRRLLAAALGRSGYRVTEAGDARQALAALAIDRPELVLLDLGLPDRDGIELVPLLGAGGAVVLVVSARDATEEKVAALDLGADDFVTKPFDTEEVLARIRTALRRRRAADTGGTVVTAGAVTIDLAARAVRRDGVAVHLTPKEYDLLATLARHAGRVVTHVQLLRTIWGPAHERDVEYLRVAARGVRRKLGDDAARLIRNEPGVGYRLVTDPAALGGA